MPLAAALLALGGSSLSAQVGPTPTAWRQHEMARPRPPVVAPAARTAPAPPPADAVVLFDGSDMSGWVGRDGTPAWIAQNGYMEAVPGRGPIQSREEFGDVQLHVEWSAPNPPNGTSQDRGNSGILLMAGRYEVQVLDSYQADTYADGQAGAIYGQYPPLFNATRAPGEWQTYDIYFRRPRFSERGALLEPARMTVVHNGILIQNNEILRGETSYLVSGSYTAQPEQAPLQLQDHAHPVRYRNIWARRLPERPEPAPGYVPRGVPLSTAQLDRLAGSYFRAPNPNATAQQQAAAQQNPTPAYTINRDGNALFVRIGTSAPQRAIPLSENQLWLAHTAATMTFAPIADGSLQLTWDMGGSRSTAIRRASTR
ncbi:MAG: DUF1080 domain-containing protein [Gemmatimonadetes bacterium]|nr:DUF1080 domain-containing protein [Gemmatimonadota bacterium]